MVTLRLLMGVFGVTSILIMIFLGHIYLRSTFTVKRIIKSKSVEQFSCMPYAMTVLNCLLYTWYGLPFVTQNNLLISTVNGTGAMLEFIYVLVFIIYAPKKEKARILGVLVFVLSVITSVALVSMFGVPVKCRKLLCGLVAAIFCIVMYASPLSVMRLVIKTKSVEYMPFCLSLFVFLSGTSWFIYGLLGADPFVFVPNGLGSVLGMMQLVLYAIYREKDMKSKKTVEDAGSSMDIDPENPNQKKQQDST
ncbi:hypothetical protein CRG98_035492 [Punica granatum]|uniref:Bidirectional sugar transporter SWEET n=1 Tax=Punica granatum TaxID=22663 RepID=A0A2I0IJF2_PUNGR|nr:hypothetical protein CRG98_035492 [Punica granatum]